MTIPLAIDMTNCEAACKGAEGMHATIARRVQLGMFIAIICKISLYMHVFGVCRLRYRAV